MTNMNTVALHRPTAAIKPPENATWPLADDPETERGPSLELNAHNHSLMREGAYKTWLQLRHQGKVLSAPFTLDIRAPAGMEAVQPVDGATARCR